jgi:hypothetical protein
VAFFSCTVLYCVVFLIFSGGCDADAEALCFEDFHQLGTAYLCVLDGSMIVGHC